MPATRQRRATTLRPNEIGRKCLAVRIRLLSRTISRIYDAALRPHGMTIAQLNILATIQPLQPAAAGAVADVLSMEISTLSRNARLMQKEGWIEIELAEHGNGRVLELTASGEHKLAEVLPAWARAQREAEELLGAEGARQITQLVDGLWVQRFSVD